MKILFIISCINSKSKGLGGHYHSLKETVKSLQPYYQVYIACVGNIYPKALINFEKEANIEILDFTSSKFRPLFTLSSLSYQIKKEKIDLVHSFDRNALYYGRLISFKHKIPSVLTKCGGNNEGYLPYVENIICFSKENYDYLKSKRKFSEVKTYLIPNRISHFESDKINIENIKSTIKDFNGSHIILRISRIGRYYMQTNKNLINLIQKLNENGVKSKGIFVGTIEDEECYKELLDESDNNIYFFTDDLITKNARSIIDCADIVVGTGRSIMEAMSKSKIVLSPIKSSHELALVDYTNFDQLFYSNFSERGEIKNFNSSENFTKISNSFIDKKYKKEITDYIEGVYFQYFDVENLHKNHLKVYENATKNIKFHLADFIKHTILQIKIYRSKETN